MSTTYDKRDYPQYEHEQTGVQRGPASILIIATLIITMSEVPTVTTPLISVFNISHSGDSFSAIIRYKQASYFATAHSSNDRTIITGLYKENEITQGSLGPDTNGMSGCGILLAPLFNGSFTYGNKSPQICSREYWNWWIDWCNLYPTSGGCTGFSYFERSASCLTPPNYQSCTDTWYLHLSATDAINAETAIIVIAFVTTIAGGLALPPLGAVVAILPALLAIGFQQIYGNDKNPDNSFDMWTPVSWQNIMGALTGIGYFEVATPHYWWGLYFDGVPVNLGVR